MDFTTNPYFGTESGHYTKKPTVQVGGRLMVGEKGSIGDRVNIVPALCKCEVDIRTVPGQTGEGVIKEFQTLVEELKKEDPDINAKMEPFTCLDPQELSPDSEVCPTNSDYYFIRIRRYDHSITGRTERSQGLFDKRKGG